MASLARQRDHAGGATRASRRGENLYRVLLEGMPLEPSPLLVIPPVGEPFAPQGAIVGLTMETSRGELVKGLMEGVMLYLAHGQERLEHIGDPH